MPFGRMHTRLVLCCSLSDRTAPKTDPKRQGAPLYTDRSTSPHTWFWYRMQIGLCSQQYAAKETPACAIEM